MNERERNNDAGSPPERSIDVARGWLEGMGLAAGAATVRSVAWWISEAVRGGDVGLLTGHRLAAFGVWRREHGADAREVVSELDRLLAEVKASDVDAAAPRGLDRRWADYRTFALRAFDRNAIAFSSTEQTLERLARAYRHELRNRLNPIALQIGLLRIKVDADAAAREEALRRMETAMRSLESVPDDALAVAASPVLAASEPTVGFTRLMEQLTAAAARIAPASPGLALRGTLPEIDVARAPVEAAVAGAINAGTSLGTLRSLGVVSARDTLSILVSITASPGIDRESVTAGPDFALCRRALTALDGRVDLRGGGGEPDVIHCAFPPPSDEPAAP